MAEFGWVEGMDELREARVEDAMEPMTKRAIRAPILAARDALDPAAVAARADAIADHLMALAEEHGARTVTAYASLGTEPGTRPALDRLHAAGIRVLLPVLLPDLDLDWAEYTPGEWRVGRYDLDEPVGPPLGVDAIGAADLVFCPGTAGTLAGLRLGRGGGCYDRALTRARPDAPRCLVLYDEDVLESLPVEPHDQRVDVIVTPSAVRVASPGRQA